MHKCWNFELVIGRRKYLVVNPVVCLCSAAALIALVVSCMATPEQ